MEFDVLDINCILGKQMDPFAIKSPGELLSIMDSRGIDEAFVSAPAHVIGVPNTGESKRLYPVFNAIPHYTGECSPPVLMEACHAVRVFPVFHRVKLHLWLWKELLDVLCEHRLPIMVDFSNSGWQDDFDYDSIHQICETYPDIPVIIMRASASCDRYLYKLWDMHMNLYIDTSFYQPNHGLHAVTSRFSARVLLFGSGLPRVEPDSPLNAVLHSGLSEEDMALILSGNAKRIIKESIPW